jgi:hypothetical protein
MQSPKVCIRSHKLWSTMNKLQLHISINSVKCTSSSVQRTGEVIGPHFWPHLNTGEVSTYTYSFIYGLFNESLRITNYMASNATIINKLQTMWKWSSTNMRFFPSQDLNNAPPEYKSDMLQLIYFLILVIPCIYACNHLYTQL